MRQRGGRWAWIAAGILLGIVVGFNGICLLAGRRITLVAETPVPLWDEPDGRQVITTLPPGQQALVTGCKDAHHYFAPRVELSGGRSAYAVGGQFRLIRRPGWPCLSCTVAYSC